MFEIFNIKKVEYFFEIPCSLDQIYVHLFNAKNLKFCFLKFVYAWWKTVFFFTFQLIIWSNNLISSLANKDISRKRIMEIVNFWTYPQGASPWACSRWSSQSRSSECARMKSSEGWTRPEGVGVVGFPAIFLLYPYWTNEFYR